MQYYFILSLLYNYIIFQKPLSQKNSFNKKYPIDNF